MKILFLPVILIGTMSGFARETKSKVATPKSEISFSYNFGISNRLFQKPGTGNFTRLDYMDARSYYDDGYMLRYNYTLLQKKANRFLVGTGVGVFNSRHYQPITDLESHYSLDNIVFDSRNVCIPVSVAYEREVIIKKLFLEISYSRNWDLPVERQSTYEGGELKKHDFIDYTYQINVRRDDYKSHWLILTSKLKLTKGLFLNSSISYLSGRKISYDYHYTTKKQITDLTTGDVHNYTSSVYSLPDIEIKDNYLYLSLGLTYKF